MGEVEGKVLVTEGYLPPSITRSYTIGLDRGHLILIINSIINNKGIRVSLFSLIIRGGEGG